MSDDVNLLDVIVYYSSQSTGLLLVDCQVRLCGVRCECQVTWGTVRSPCLQYGRCLVVVFVLGIDDHYHPPTHGV